MNVVGIDQVFARMKEVFASLYNDRAISYRVHKGFAHSNVALSAGVQRMVRSDKGAAGVMFTLDTESGFDQVVFITASYGLGETVVQGAVNPDEYYVDKPIMEQGKFPLIRKVLGSKKIKMVFDLDKSSGRSVKVVEVPEADRKKFSSWLSTLGLSKSTMAVQWILSGEKTVLMANFTFSRPVRKQ